MGEVETEVREELEELEEREEMEELEEREETVRRRWTVESSTVESEVPQPQPQGGAEQPEPQPEPPQPPDSNAVSELVRLGVPSGLHPPPGSMPRTGLLGPNAMEQPNRNVIGMGRSRLCEYHLGMRSTWCNRGSNCEFAHRLSQLDVPNEFPHDGKWWTVWHEGQVDICFRHHTYRSEDSKKRFKRAFLREKVDCSERIPNWAWGLAAHSNIIPHDIVPTDVPFDYGWPQLQVAWEEGLRG